MAIKGVSPRQKVWDYMRRNRTGVTVKDVMILTGIGIDQLRRYFSALQRAEYIKESKKAQSFKEREYRLIKCTGVIAPVAEHNKNILIDKNLNTKISTRVVPVYERVWRGIIKLKEEEKEIKLNPLLECGSRSSVKREIEFLLDKKVLVCVKKVWGGFIYEVETKRLKELLEKKGKRMSDEYMGAVA